MTTWWLYQTLAKNLASSPSQSSPLATSRPTAFLSMPTVMAQSTACHAEPPLRGMLHRTWRPLNNSIMNTWRLVHVLQFIKTHEVKKCTALILSSITKKKPDVRLAHTRKSLVNSKFPHCVLNYRIFKIAKLIFVIFQLENCPLDRKTFIVKQPDNFIINRVITQGEVSHDHNQLWYLDRLYCIQC